MTQVIKAQVNERLLTKAARLFTGTIDGRIIEILQNARFKKISRQYRSAALRDSKAVFQGSYAQGYYRKESF